MQPSSEMVDIYIRGPHGPEPVRFCQRCAAPKLTYIAGRLRIGRVDIPRVLGFTFGITIAVLNVLLGRLVAGPLGLFVAIAGILCGAGVSIAFAVSVAMPQGSDLSI